MMVILFFYQGRIKAIKGELQNLLGGFYKKNTGYSKITSVSKKNHIIKAHLLHGNRFGQVTRLVHIGTSHHCYMVRKQLERYH